MKKIIAAFLFVSLLFVSLMFAATSVSWGKGKGSSPRDREGVTWEK